MYRETKAVLTLAVALAFIGSFAIAANEPTSPTELTPSGPSTFDESNYADQTVEALAGNVTALTIAAIGQTKTWQGYYGNITASITLDDANSNTFYNWSAAEPRGQVYATLNNSITWGNVGCYDFASGTFADESTIETFYGIATDDVDGVAETFNQTDHPSFEVASRTMSGCPTTYIFQNDAYQQQDFANVLLYDNSTAINQTGWIYTTLIENKTAGSTNDLVCYNNQECDFQILVNDDGHGTDTQTTTYYFWVEIV